MKRVVGFPLEEGGVISVEIDEPDVEGGLEQMARPGELLPKATRTLESALSTVRQAANAVILQVRQLTDLPDDVEIEFGIKLSAEAGAVLASAAAEANYKVLLKWTAK